MVRVHGHIPPPVPPSGKGKGAGEGPSTPLRAGEGKSGKPVQIGRGPELDAHAIAVALSVAAKEAKEKELSFEKIIQRVVDLTGINNPQAAMEEANRRLQKEIEDTIIAIKSNKELMEEAEGWEEFGKLMEAELSPGQVKEFLTLLHKEIQ